MNTPVEYTKNKKEKKENRKVKLCFQVDRMIPVAGTAELTNFNHLFWKKTRKNLTDGHIWFSVVQRPKTSRFTRTQRLTCCICLLFTSMMASILFYKQEPTGGMVCNIFALELFTPKTRSNSDLVILILKVIMAD